MAAVRSEDLIPDLARPSASEKARARFAYSEDDADEWIGAKVQTFGQHWLLQDENGIEIDGVSKLYPTAQGARRIRTGSSMPAPSVGGAHHPRDPEGRQTIEARVGRAPNIRWGPSAADVEILFVNDLIVDSRELNLPHPVGLSF